MLARQIKCQNGKRHRIVWTDDIGKLEIGKFAQFKDEEERWEITDIYDPIQDSQDIKRTWHVGGL
jgi:hypothetical protein